MRTVLKTWPQENKNIGGRSRIRTSQLLCTIEVLKTCKLWDNRFYSVETLKDKG